MGKPKVLIISTGGTISSKYEHEKGYTPALTAQDLVSNLGGLDEFVEIEALQFCSLLSFALTPNQMLELINRIRLKMKEGNYVGAVVTQGTATIEETSYLADLLWDMNQPLVFTGAMLNASERDSDGPKNLYHAVLVAASPKASGKGVLVCMGGEIRAARDVMKIHKSSINAFVSINTGPLGFVSKYQVIFHRQPLLREVFPVKHLETHIGILKVGLGTGSQLLESFISSGVKGIVLEAFPGGGGVTPEIMHSIKKSNNENIIFVLTPRSPMGSVVSRASGGCGPWDLFERGIINGGDLPSVKARILLMVTLPLVNNKSDLQKVFDEVSP